MWERFFVVLLLALMPHAILSAEQLEVEAVYEWKQMVFGFATEVDRQDAIDNGNLSPENATPIDVAVHQDCEKGSRVFTTIPRFTTGIPYTLAVVTEANEANGPVLQPYPDYSWHNSNGSDCDKITSVFRVAITECNQLFVLDSGVIAQVQRCSPQLLVFDLNSDTLSYRYRFDPSTYTAAASLFITPIVSVNDPPPTGSCSKVQVYMTDVALHGLVVYDSELNTAWRIQNRFMYPNPENGVHSLAGELFTLMDGIFGLASDDEQLYFHPLASVHEYAVPLSVVSNRTIFENSSGAMSLAFRQVATRSSSCAAEAIDSQNNIYCVTFNPVMLTRWNPNKPYNVQMPADPQLLEFVSGMKVHKNDTGNEELWMMSNRYQKVANGNLDFNEVNFRIVRRSLDDVQNATN
ncbi:dopaminechrome tautomerase-like [Bactrocera oleae]|uniref:dopaminechrome tautomerase-like n=1 Tax=Bactrocera oleae TaxID=104688 RepID=UPI00387E31A8